jgi:hypothetical protein
MLSFLFHCLLCFIFSHPEICARTALHWWLVGDGEGVWQATWCMCVVLSSGLRRNSYTPAGRVRGVVGVHTME